MRVRVCERARPRLRAAMGKSALSRYAGFFDEWMWQGDDLFETRNGSRLRSARWELGNRL